MTLPPRHLLSKSTFLYGSQCAKRLYLYKFRPDLKEEVSNQQQAVFDRGTNVGILARNLFPGGVDASPESTFEYQKAAVKTSELIASGTQIIYEAVFQFDGVLAAIDILVKDRGKWKAYEVKSTTQVKDIHITDAALQYHVITNSGILLADISIVHLNTEYIRKGKLMITELFEQESVKTEAIEMQAEIRKTISELKAMLAKKQEPKVDIGPHCSDPYECDFMDYCWSHIPEVSVFSIARLRSNKKFELYNKGIIHYKEVRDEIELTSYQQLQVDSHLNKKGHIDKESIRAFIATIPFPLYFLDFETFQSAIPLYDQSRSYQQIPFQYSLHYQKSPDSTLQHFEFLADAKGGDPRLPFIEQLLAETQNPGLILTYNKSFEKSILTALARDFPKHSIALENLIERLRDLMVPFQQGMYYLPEMNGSYSIKNVLPALIPALSYDDLEIGDGSSASLAFEEMMYNPAADIPGIRKSLLGYCGLDTLAMVKIVDNLFKI